MQDPRLRLQNDLGERRGRAFAELVARRARWPEGEGPISLGLVDRGGWALDSSRETSVELLRA